MAQLDIPSDDFVPSPKPSTSELVTPTLDPADVDQVRRALALAWTARHRNWLIAYLTQVGAKTIGGRAFTSSVVDDCLRELLRREVVASSEAGWQLRVGARVQAYRDAIRGDDFDRWRDALMYIEGVRPDRPVVYFQRDNQAITLARLVVYGGGTLEQWRSLEAGFVGIGHSGAILDQVALSGFDPELFPRVDRSLAGPLLGLALHIGLRDLDPHALEALAYARRWVEREGDRLPPSLRRPLIEWLILSGEPVAAEALAASLPGSDGALLRGAALATRGQWQTAIDLFDQGWAELKAEPRTRRPTSSPDNIRWLYPMCLFATRDVTRIAAARKFALAESGARNPDAESFWGLWVHAADMRLGDRPRDVNFATMSGWQAAQPTLAQVPRRLLQAWSAAGHAAVVNPGSSQALLTRLRQCRLDWAAEQVEAADRVLAGRSAGATAFFASGGAESWREALAAIAALNTERAGASANSSTNDTRMLWVLSVDREQRLVGIDPYEQKRGVKGWGKAKSVSLARLSRSATLDPLDARVARAIKPDRSYGANRIVVDLMQAAPALIGHPRVVFADDLDRPVALEESLPDIRVVEDGEYWSFRFDPDLGLALNSRRPRDDADDDPFDGGAARARDNALRTQFVIRDDRDPRISRARLIRLTPAHRRVVELTQSGLKVPRSAGAEIQTVLPVLASHFRLQADAVQGAVHVQATGRLRAEMARRGEAIVLRLVAAPLGALGPRVVPGHGRVDLVAIINGTMHSTRRALDRERESLDTVLAQFEFLDPPAEGDDAAMPEWTLVDPQQALALVEALPKVEAVEGIDWPGGQPVRIVPPDPHALKVRVRSEGHWFVLDGAVKVDDGKVVELSRLIDWVGNQRSRFVPIGEGTYLALTDSLRQRIEDLAAVVERPRASRSGTPPTTLKVARAAAQWVDQVLSDDVEREVDEVFANRIEQLNRATALRLDVPGGLQADLRPYQLDGFNWIMQRAQAGLGACLADDMGLGKTVQSLAVMLARASRGPTLVVAPTSVCGNWAAEATRFAPSLNVTVYRTDARAAVVLPSQPMDVVIVSYTQLQQADKLFGDMQWATLIIDEAQAIKNASAKRSQAVAAVPAEFRLALSGTPIENRLSELWSIMNVINPGLLGGRERFAERFVVPIERSRDVRAQRVLRRLIGPYVLRRTKSQVLDDLPPRTEVTLTVTPSADESAHYEALRREAMAVALSASASTASTGRARTSVAARGAAAVTSGVQSGNAAQGRFHVLAQLTRLRRAACDPRLVNPELGIVGAKVLAFTELVAELVANRHKALVFSQFVDFLGLLRAAVETAGISYQYLDGSTPVVERERAVNAFQAGDGDLFLISLKAGGFGLNLTAADYVVIVDPWWNPAAEDQAMGRAHRIGQQRPVTVYRLVTEQTIEQRIVALHHDKRALADGILDDIDSTAAPSVDDLLELLAD